MIAQKAAKEVFLCPFCHHVPSFLLPAASASTSRTTLPPSSTSRYTPPSKPRIQSRSFHTSPIDLRTAKTSPAAHRTQPHKFRHSGPPKQSRPAAGKTIQALWKETNKLVMGTGESHRLMKYLDVDLKKTDPPTRETLAAFKAMVSAELEGLELGRESVLGPDEDAFDIQRITSLLELEGPDAITQAVLSRFISFAARRELAHRSKVSITSTSSSSPPPSPPPPSKLLQFFQITDFRFPGESYYFTRRMKRSIHLHVGPTNSGKTYTALSRLAQARTGVYAGPLRLLAHEVATRFNQGKIGGLTEPRACNLVTGEERRVIDTWAGLTSCTVEMMNFNRHHDVAVIDEIQLISDPQRGTAWTMALLAVQANELHLCGEPSVVELVKGIAETLGDEVTVHRYERLSPLAVADSSLEGDLKKIKKGDCVVTFSRNNIFAMKQQIEASTGLQVAVAYGGLPPEVREEQARKFNDGTCQVMVASDAIGMGLNLAIRRVIFESMWKWDGQQAVQLTVSAVKQIGGRAGRYKVPLSPSSPDEPEPEVEPSTTAAPAPAAAAPEGEKKLGIVTTLERDDLKILKRLFPSPTNPIGQAALLPDFEKIVAVQSLCSSGKSPRPIPFGDLNKLINMGSRTSRHFFIPQSKNRDVVNEELSKVGPLSLAEMCLFGNAPFPARDPIVRTVFAAFIRSYVAGEEVDITDWVEKEGFQALVDGIKGLKTGEEGLRRRRAKLEEMKDPGMRKTEESAIARRQREIDSASVFTSVNLAKLESLHRCLVLYLWVSFRLPLVFCHQEEAQVLKRMAEEAIDYILFKLRVRRRVVPKPKPAAATMAQWSDSPDRVDVSDGGRDGLRSIKVGGKATPGVGVEGGGRRLVQAGERPGSFATASSPASS